MERKTSHYDIFNALENAKMQNGFDYWERIRRAQTDSKFGELRKSVFDKGVDYMGKTILEVIVTLIVGYLGTVVGLELLGNWDEFGLLIAIAVMGAFIIYFNDKK